jgi:two-component sensor histidine kinase/ligand-binding sensor domain-containing protein
MKFILRFTAIVIIFFIDVYSLERDIQFTHLTTEDGLSLNVVTEVLQDSRGFLWFGTYNGLNRYDGYNFKTFLPEPTNSKSISNYSIWSLYEDSRGDIWIGTLDGLNRYDWKTEEFYRYKNVPGDTNSLSNDYVFSIMEDKSGTLWIGTLNGLSRYNRNKDNFTVFKIVSDKENTNSLNSVTCIEEDHKGNLWLGTWNGITILQKDGKKIYKHLPEPTKFNISLYNDINVIFEDNSNYIWIGTRGKGLYRYNPLKDEYILFSTVADNPNSLSDNSVNTIFQDRLDNLWVGTKNGLNKFNRRHNNFTRIFHDPLKPLSLNNNEISSIIEDKTGIIWVGTSGGVSRFYQTASGFKSFNENPYYSNKLGNKRVNALFVDKQDNIWVGTKEGLFEILQGTNPDNTAANQIISYTHNPENNNSLSDNHILAILQDHQGLMWIGTDRGGLNCYNPFTKTFKVYRSYDNDIESITNNGVISLCEDNKRNLWVGTWWGFNHFDRKKEKFKRYFDVFEHNVIWFVYSDSKGMLWLGSDGSGASMYNPNTKTFTNFICDSTKKDNISANRIISILESHDGIMWFGTLEGLYSYNRNSGKFKSYNQKNGLPSVFINAIQEDAKGFLWISTDKGLSKFNRKTGSFVNFTKRDGLEDIEFSPGASGKLSNGNLVFGSNTGIIIFNPDSIKEEHWVVPIVFTDLKIHNQSVPISSDGSSILKESIVHSKVISIPYDNDVITIEFALLDYYNPKGNKFTYKLVGFDSDWNNVGSRNSTTYTNLPPGEYTLLVKASNSTLNSYIEEASLKIIIVPAFFQTIWFKILLGLAIIITTVLFIQTRTNRIKKRNKMLELKITEHTKDLDKTINELSQEIIERKRAEAKAQASLEEKEFLLKENETLLKEIHHRVKNNLQVISSLLYLNSRKINDINVRNIFKESQNRVKSIALVHERLYQSRDFGRIDFKEYVQKLTSDLFSSYGVNEFVIKLENKIKNILISIDIAVPCGLIINELVSNSLKHAFPNYEEENKTGIIRIDFYRVGENELFLEVGDNGIGIPEGVEEKKNNSLGLMLVETLITQVEGSFNIDLSSGTLFTIKFKESNNVQQNFRQWSN